jgi:hypothetical protein
VHRNFLITLYILMGDKLYFFISNFRHFLNVVCFLLGVSPASVAQNLDAGESPIIKHTRYILVMDGQTN